MQRRCHKCQHPFAGRERGVPLVVAVSGWLTNARHNMTHDPCPDTSLWSIKPSRLSYGQTCQQVVHYVVSAPASHKYSGFTVSGIMPSPPQTPDNPLLNWLPDFMFSFLCQNSSNLTLQKVE